MIRSVGLGRAGGLTGGSAVIGAAAAVATAGVTAPAGGQSLASGLRRDIHTIPRVQTVEYGEPGTLDWRLYFHDGKRIISPFHDLPLSPVYGASGVDDGIFTFVNEIPKGTDAKMEIATTERYTPMAQDTKDGALRFIKHSKLDWNYGCIPRTWENPREEHDGFGGDNDPLDVVELSGRPLERGAVIPIKVLGVLGLIDEGECDYKVLAVDARDPRAHLVTDVSEWDRGQVDAVREWYKVYKVAEGKPTNEYIHGGEALDAAYAQTVIWQTFQEYARLISGHVKDHGLSLQ